MKTAARHQNSGEVFACQNYLDDTVNIDGAPYTRRAVVLAIEDLKQDIEAPLTLQSEARAQLSLLNFYPIPELKLYRDIATAILRLDAAFHLTKMNKTAKLRSKFVNDGGILSAAS